MDVVSVEYSLNNETIKFVLHSNTVRIYGMKNKNLAQKIRIFYSGASSSGHSAGFPIELRAAHLQNLIIKSINCPGLVPKAEQNDAPSVPSPSASTHTSSTSTVPSQSLSHLNLNVDTEETPNAFCWKELLKEHGPYPKTGRANFVANLLSTRMGLPVDMDRMEFLHSLAKDPSTLNGLPVSVVARLVDSVPKKEQSKLDESLLRYTQCVVPDVQRQRYQRIERDIPPDSQKLAEVLNALLAAAGDLHPPTDDTLLEMWSLGILAVNMLLYGMRPEMVRKLRLEEWTSARVMPEEHGFSKGCRLLQVHRSQTGATTTLLVNICPLMIDAWATRVTNKRRAGGIAESTDALLYCRDANSTRYINSALNVLCEMLKLDAYTWKGSHFRRMACQGDREVSTQIVKALKERGLTDDDDSSEYVEDLVAFNTRVRLYVNHEHENYV